MTAGGITTTTDYTYDGITLLSLDASRRRAGQRTRAAIAERQPLRSAGYVYDIHSQTYYLSQRHYDPATMRFLSKDPIRADGEESAYQYAAGDPVGKVDPTGLAWIWMAFRYATNRDVGASHIRITAKALAPILAAALAGKVAVVGKGASVLLNIGGTIGGIVNSIRGVSSSVVRRGDLIVWQVYSFASLARPSCRDNATHSVRQRVVFMRRDGTRGWHSYKIRCRPNLRVTFRDAFSGRRYASSPVIIRWPRRVGSL